LTGNPLQPITDYLFDLQGCLMFGRCAGKTTRLSKLHQNRLISDDHRLFQLDKLDTIFNTIIETNFSREIELDSELIQRINAIRDLYWSENDVETDGEDTWSERDVNPLWPYWYARWFDEEKKQFHVDEDMEVISPSISEQERANALKFCEKMLADGLSNLLTLENLQSIEDGVKKLYDTILLTITHKDAKAEYEFIQESQSIEEMILDQEAYIKDARAELEEFREAMHNFPKRDRPRTNLHTEFEKEEQRLVATLERELSTQEGHVRRKQFVEEKMKRAVLQAKSNKIDPALSQFLTFYESNNHSIFGDIPTFIQSILLGEVPLNDVIQVMEETGGLVSIIGHPGFGKTIQLRQFTYKLIANQLEENSTNIIPIYVKAKSLSKNIQAMATSPFGFSFGDSESSTEYHGNSTSSKEEAVEIFINSMLQTEPELDEHIVRNLFGMQRNVFDNMYLIIDAYDEILSEERRMEIISFIDDNIERHHCPVVITCRKSHSEELTNFFNEVNGEINTHNCLDIHFTSHELRFEMPTKLANAWGMNSDQLSLSAANLYQEYETVLTHPLFVGFFCMLLSHDALHPSDSNNPYLKQSKSNGKDGSDSTVSLQHVAFLKRVIEFGLEINVKERQSISEDEIARIRKLFCYIAATYITTGLSNLESILKYVAKYHDISPSAREKQILNDNLGVMFVNSEKDIDWTHKTLPEVATGLLILEEPDYKKYLIREYGSIFGRNGDLWSECLLMTLIQEDLEDSTGKPFVVLSGLFDSMGNRSLVRTLNMFGGKRGNLRDIRYEDGSYTFKVTNTTVFRKTIIEALANSYFSALLRGNPFPIPNSILGKRISGAFALHLFNRSNMTNGLYSDVVTEPLKMRLPNVDMDTIFQRFENDIEKVCAFYWERRGMYPLSKVCEGGRQQEKSLLERLTNEIQALPSTFAFSFVPSYEMICSSFTSKRRLELMEEILSRCTAKYEFSIWTSKIDFEIDEIENKSLQKLSPLFESVRKRINGPKENHLEIKNMVNLFPNISRIIILNALVLHIHSNLKEDDILNVRSAFGLPRWPYPTLKEALNLMQDDGEETTGNFEILPSWIPIEAYVMGGRNNVMQKVFQKTQLKGVLEK
tara:strand:- start:4676 stop:8008 length:3333 start_codon:yes stop_codon:yes gene_type:complete